MFFHAKNIQSFFFLFFITAILTDEMGLGKTIQVSNRGSNLS
jgi:SNF2 family DNA or RNA helicase